MCRHHVHRRHVLGERGQCVELHQCYSDRVQSGLYDEKLDERRSEMSSGAARGWMDSDSVEYCAGLELAALECMHA